MSSPETTHTQDPVAGFAHEFVVTLVNLELYPLTSDHLRHSLHSMERELNAFHGKSSSPLILEFEGNQILHGGKTLLGSTLQAGRLLRLCRQRDINAIVFESEIETEELMRFILLLSSQHDVTAFHPSLLERSFEQHGIKHIKVTVGQDRPRSTPRDDEEAGATERNVTQYQSLADYLQESHVAAFKGEELSIDKASDLVESAINQMSHEPSVLLALATYDDIDSFTVGHSVRVALLALQVAQAAGASRQELIRVGTAALLHDIGKAHIPQNILFKRGPLDEEEREIMAQHPRLGGEILLEQQDLDKTAIGAAFCHHMSPKGGGYPHPALPFEPSGVSKLVRVCDVFEALTAVRPYKQALNTVEAYSVMLRMQGGFDPKWLRFFIQVMGIYPQGTTVSLSDGSKGIVAGQGASLESPEILLLVDSMGLAVPADQRYMVSVGMQSDGRELQICNSDSTDEDLLIDGPSIKHEHDAHEQHGPTSCCGEDLLGPNE